MVNEICLFDVDGTLTKPRNVISDDFLTYLLELNTRIPVAVVSGSDYDKVEYQLGGSKSNENELLYHFFKAMSNIKFTFSENGLVVHEFGRQTRCTLKLPIKRGTFVEFRKGLINLCPIGRSCSQMERDSFIEFEKEHNIREAFVEDLRKRFTSSSLEFAIGGQISIDAYPTGWDKRYCLQFLTSQYDKIHFFGDKITPGGNDHLIFCDSRTIGYSVKSPEDTLQQLEALFPKPVDS